MTQINSLDFYKLTKLNGFYVLNFLGTSVFRLLIIYLIYTELNSFYYLVLLFIIFYISNLISITLSKFIAKVHLKKFITLCVSIQIVSIVLLILVLGYEKNTFLLVYVYSNIFLFYFTTQLIHPLYISSITKTFAITSLTHNLTKAKKLNTFLNTFLIFILSIPFLFIDKESLIYSYVVSIPILLILSLICALLTKPRVSNNNQTNKDILIESWKYYIAEIKRGSDTFINQKYTSLNIIMFMINFIAGCFTLLAVVILDISNNIFAYGIFATSVVIGIYIGGWIYNFVKFTPYKLNTMFLVPSVILLINCISIILSENLLFSLLFLFSISIITGFLNSLFLHHVQLTNSKNDYSIERSFFSQFTLASNVFAAILIGLFIETLNISYTLYFIVIVSLGIVMMLLIVRILEYKT